MNVLYLVLLFSSCLVNELMAMGARHKPNSAGRVVIEKKEATSCKKSRFIERRNIVEKKEATQKVKSFLTTDSNEKPQKMREKQPPKKLIRKKYLTKIP